MPNRYSIKPERWSWTVMEHGVAGEKSKTPGAPTEEPVAYCKSFEFAATWIYERDARMKAQMMGLVDAFKAARDEVIATVRACEK